MEKKRLYHVSSVANGEMIPIFEEAYPGALKRMSNGVSCSIYEVDPTTFEEGKTSFPVGELVSEKPVKILKERRVKNLYPVLLKLIENNKIKFVPYNKDEKYRQKMYNHIKSRIEMFKPYLDKEGNSYRFCKDYFPNILAEVEEEVNAKKV